MIFNRNNHPPGHYVYAYLRKSDTTPYYIGKGIAKRAWEKHRLPIPSDDTLIMIIEHGLTNQQALDLEIKLIKEYGRIDIGTGILRNLTDGGGYNRSGRPHLQETKDKISAAKKGNQSPLKGRKRPQDVIDKIRQALIGHNVSETARQKMSDARKRYVTSDETKSKLSAAGKGRIVTEETRTKLSAKLKGRVFTPEWRAKLSAARRNITE